MYDLSFTVDLEPLIHIKQLDPSLNQLVNQSSITVLRLIKFAKRLEEFVRLSQVLVQLLNLIYLFINIGLSNLYSLFVTIMFVIRIFINGVILSHMCYG